MKWIRMFSAAIALCGLTASVNAGLFGHGGCKSCGCAEDCQPACCKPTIARPCCPNVYTYQRKCSDIKPPCCDSCCPESCCAPAACGNACGPECCAPAACGNACGPECCAPAGCGTGCDPSCCAPAGCGTGCCAEGCCSTDDTCEIAQLIYQSMTACYARDRERAIHKLGDRYDCCCHPEIMNAFIYALNDAVEDVRQKAADEIGDQVRRNRCCCSPCVVSALTCALGDCDRGVRRQAEEALELCGYEVIDGCCDSCCETPCAPTCGAPCNGCGTGYAPATAAPVNAAPAQPAPAGEAVPAPAPPEEPQAYFPSRLNKTTASKGKVRSSLAGLFGLAR